MPVRPYASSTAPRKNSIMSSAAAPVLSTFAIDLIAQFDNYRVNMRESLQREVEENIYKAKVLKEAMKESSDRDAEILISVEDEEYNINGSSTPSNRSNTSLNRFQQSQLQSQQSSSINSYLNDKSGIGAKKEKKSALEKLFGRKSNVNSKVTPHPSSNSPSLLPSNTLTVHGNSSTTHSTTHSNNSAADVADLKYLPVDEESEEEVLDRSMAHGAGVGGINSGPIGTEVKLHPTRAKTFALPKSLKNLKRRIAALRAKGTDLDAEKREKEAREKANGGVGASDEKKKFTLIRLLPWKSAKKPEPVTKPTDSVISPSNTMTSSIVA
ncbi:hypothetical protein BGZ76_011780 [Entomortierella beljakovae]|nr:hypothetical protein BGZ76_011780 [Entomortierella beljakovae]